MKDVINMNLRHITNFGGLSVNGTQIAGGVPERTYSVSPNFALDEQSHESPTIQGGIDMAYADWGPITDWSHRVIILVHPGKYVEQIHSYAGYHIQGFTHEASSERKTAVLYNTGADVDHYPLRGDDSDNYYIEGMNVQVDSGGVIGKIGAHYFTKVNFRRGDFIEATEDGNTYMAFKDCAFHLAGFNLTGAQVTGQHNIQINDCWLSRYSWVTSSTHNETCSFYIDNCVFNRSYPNLGGDWNMQILNSHVFGATKTQIGTTGDIIIIDSIISNGLHFTSDPNVVKIQSCGFEDNEGYPITGCDVSTEGSLIVTTVSYINNVQQNGLSGNIQYISSIKNVGSYVENTYCSVQDAINSCVTKSTIVVYEDMTGLAELTMPNEVDITIDGQKTYSLTFTGDIIEIGDNRKCGFSNFRQLTGGEINLNGASAEVSFEDMQYITAHLVINNGVFAIVYKSSFFGSTGNPAITMNSLTCPAIVGYSRIQGSTGQAAIVTTVEADDKLKAKFSSLVSGTPVTIAPLIYTGADKLSIHLYNCGLSGTFDAGKYTNEIGQANLTYDPNIIF